MFQRPKTVTAALILILVSAAFWLTWAVITALGGIHSLTGMGTARWVMSVLALGCAVCLAGLAYFLSRRSRLAYILGVGLLALLAVLSITDQVGLIDLFSLLVILIPLVLLIKDRRWYLQTSHRL
jgi:hypothetical protein